MSGRRPTNADGLTARFRPRRLAGTNGEWLVLQTDGTVERRDAAGATIERWAAAEPAWAEHALRFGLRASSPTALPRGRDVPGSKPPA